MGLPLPHQLTTVSRPSVTTRSMRADAIDVAVIDAAHFRGFVDDESDTTKGGTDHHWWKGRQDKDGYGIYSLWNPATGTVTKLRAHRVAHALAHGGLPADVHVLHSPGCEDPGCCNPAHTYRGDAAANAGDRDRPARKSALAARRHQAAGQYPFPDWDRLT